MPFDFVKERRSGLHGWAFCLSKVPHFGVWKHASQGGEEQQPAGGNLIHILLVVAVIVLIFNLVSGRRSV